MKFDTNPKRHELKGDSFRTDADTNLPHEVRLYLVRTDIVGACGMSRPPDVATFRNDDNVWVSAERDPVPYEISLSCSQVSGFLCRAKKRAAVRDAGNALLRRHSTTAGSSSLASGIVAGAKDATGKRQKTRERLVVRIDDRWVDLTGWRKAPKCR